jgi:hypothetical protein
LVAILVPLKKIGVCRAGRHGYLHGITLVDAICLAFVGSASNLLARRANRAVNDLYLRNIALKCRSPVFFNAAIRRVDRES